MLLIFIRILLTWFSRADYGRPMEILCRITDPYLNWFRGFSVLKAGYMDLSPIVGMAVLSIAYNILSAIAQTGAVRIGFILAIIASSLWSAASFIFGFFIVVLALRLIAYLTNRDIYRGMFWRIVDGVSKPVLYKTNRFLFRRKIVNYRTGIIASICLLLVSVIVIGFIMRIIISFLNGLPI